MGLSVFSLDDNLIHCHVYRPDFRTAMDVFEPGTDMIDETLFQLLPVVYRQTGVVNDAVVYVRQLATQLGLFFQQQRLQPKPFRPDEAGQSPRPTADNQDLWLPPHGDHPHQSACPWQL